MIAQTHRCSRCGVTCFLQDISQRQCSLLWICRRCDPKLFAAPHETPTVPSPDSGCIVMLTAAIIALIVCLAFLLNLGGAFGAPIPFPRSRPAVTDKAIVGRWDLVWDGVPCTCEFHDDSRWSCWYEGEQWFGNWSLVLGTLIVAECTLEDGDDVDMTAWGVEVRGRWREKQLWRIDGHGADEDGELTATWRKRP